MKVKMSKSDWLKIGGYQGWIKNKDFQEEYKKHAWVNFAIKAGLLAAPYVIDWLFSGNKEAAKDAIESAKENPDELQRMVEFVNQSHNQAQSNIQRFSQLIPYLQKRAKDIGAPCSEMAVDENCRLSISSLEEFQSRSAEIEKMVSDQYRMNDQNYVCELLKKVISLNACSKNIGQQNAYYSDPGRTTSWY